MESNPFNFLSLLYLQKDPLVAILPLGTGNDLSRVLGFGEGQSCDADVMEYLQQLTTARPALLDRWRVHFTPARSLSGC